MRPRLVAPGVFGFFLLMQTGCGGDDGLSSSATMADTQLLFRITNTAVQIPDSSAKSYSVTFTLVPVVDSTDYNPTSFAYFFDNSDSTWSPVPSNELRFTMRSEEIVQFRIEDGGPPGSFRTFDPDNSTGLNSETLKVIST